MYWLIYYGFLFFMGWFLADVLQDFKFVVRVVVIFLSAFLFCIFFPRNKVCATDMKGIIFSERDMAVGVYEKKEAKGLQGYDVPKYYSWSRWPNKIVPYVIQKNVPYPQRILDAIAHYQANTKIRFVPRTTQTAYVSFQHWNGGYCWSWIGYTGKAQEVMLDPTCDARSVIHELGHAMGLWHEHTRPDRDKYVKVNYANVMKGLESNLKIQTLYSEVSGPYDLTSVMHYRPWELSGNGQPTITKLDGTTDGLSNPIGLSPGDIQTLNKMYP